MTISSNIIPITQSEQVLEDALVTPLVGMWYTLAAVSDETSILANPASEDEQASIAPFLTDLDCKRATIAAQITHTQTRKKGRLQQMLPE